VQKLKAAKGKLERKDENKERVNKRNREKENERTSKTFTEVNMHETFLLANYDLQKPGSGLCAGRQKFGPLSFPIILYVDLTYVLWNI
jgi:hypothetical protein